MSERLTVDISTDLRAAVRTGYTGAASRLMVEAADKLDGLITLLAQAETARDEAHKSIAAMLNLLRDLIDEGDCWFDHHGGCQAHGYLSLEPGEKCPHQEAKELLATHDGGQS